MLHAFKIFCYHPLKRSLGQLLNKPGFDDLCERWRTKKHTNKGSKDGNKGQGSSLLLCVLSLRLFICQTLEIVILISLLMMTKK